MIKLNKKRLLKIFTFYWDGPCKYKSGNRWVTGVVGIHTLPAIERGECVLLLKPLLMLTGPEILKMQQLAEKPKYEQAANEQEAVPENEAVIEPMTKDEVRDAREHVIEMIHEAPYPVVDYLRKEGYHVPIYGIDLFKTKLAEWQTDKVKIVKLKSHASKEPKTAGK